MYFINEYSEWHFHSKSYQILTIDMKKIYRFNRNYQNDEDSRGRKTMFASKTFDRN